MPNTQDFNNLLSDYKTKKDAYKVYETSFKLKDINKKSFRELKKDLKVFTEYVSEFSHLKYLMHKEILVNNLDQREQLRLDIISGFIEVAQNVYIVRLSARLSQKYNIQSHWLFVGSMVFGLLCVFLPKWTDRFFDDPNAGKLAAIENEIVVIKKDLKGKDSMMLKIFTNTLPKKTKSIEPPPKHNATKKSKRPVKP